MFPAVDYVRPASLAEAVDSLASFSGEARILAGGTDLLVSLRNRRAGETVRLVDVSRIAELGEIRVNGDFVEIGCCVSHAELAESPIIRRNLSLLADASATIGSVQIRNRGTVGGNLCNASPCADTAPALLALDAEAQIVGPSGERWIPLVDFFLAPYRTVLGKNELLAKLRCPKVPPGSGTAFVKLGRRNAMSIARMNVAALLRLDEAGKIAEARIAAGSIMPTAARVHSAEALLLGQVPSLEGFDRAGHQVAAEMIAAAGRRWSTPYKEKVAPVLVRRALQQARQRCRG